MADQLEIMVKRFMEAFDDPESEAIEEVISPEFVMHDPVGMGARGPEGVRELIRTLRAAFPDLTFEIHDIVTGPDRAVVRWTVQGTHRGTFMGIEPTGKHASIEGMEIARVQDGKFVEDWVVYDALGLLKQLGAVPS